MKRTRILGFAAACAALPLLWDERRLRLRIDEFETATRAAGHGW